MCKEVAVEIQADLAVIEKEKSEAVRAAAAACVLPFDVSAAGEAGDVPTLLQDPRCCTDATAHGQVTTPHLPSPLCLPLALTLPLSSSPSMFFPLPLSFSLPFLPVLHFFSHLPFPLLPSDVCAFRIATGGEKAVVQQYTERTMDRLLYR